MERETHLSDSGEQPRDQFYHGVISKIFWGNETGVIRSDSGKDVPFVFAFVTLLGAPRQDINFLRPGMRVGFDVGWTSKGLRASVIKIYDLFQDELDSEPPETPEESSGPNREENALEHPISRYRFRETQDSPDHARRRQRRHRPQSQTQEQKRSSPPPSALPQEGTVPTAPSRGEFAVADKPVNAHGAHAGGRLNTPREPEKG